MLRIQFQLPRLKLLLLVVEVVEVGFLMVLALGLLVVGVVEQQ
jgi:hypothetical protein